MNKIFESILIFFTVCFLAFSGYVYYVYKQAPGIKEKVTGLYLLFSAGRTVVPQAGDKKQAPISGWTNINAKTGDEVIERLASMSDAEIKEKYAEVKDLDRLMNGGSMQLLKLAANLVSKNKDDAVMPDEDEKQIKAMLEKIMEDYKNGRIPGIGDAEKEAEKK